MAKYEATLSAGSQVTVPSAIRRLLGLKPGDKMIFDADTLDTKTQKVTVGKALSREEQVQTVMEELERLRIEHQKQMTPEQKKFAEMTAGWTVNQYHEYFDNLPETQAYLKEKYGV